MADRLGRNDSGGPLGGLTRTLHAAAQTGETYSPAEQRFNRRRRTAGLVLGPVVFVAIWLWPLPELSVAAHRLAAVFAMVIVLWLTEAIPMAVTALLGPALTIVLGVAPAPAALAPFADPIIFLFIGSFMIGEAMFVHGVDRRIAYSALASPLVAARPARILAVYGLVAAVISMWISNTATTAMMFPIGLSVVAHLGRAASTPRDMTGFALAMMLMTSFAASIGGMATPIGTPPNLIGIGMLERIGGSSISFFRWMILGLPTAALLLAFLMAYFFWRFARGRAIPAVGMETIQAELRRLGPLTRGQRNVLVAFGVTVVLWLTPGVLAVAGAAGSSFARDYSAAIPESVAALIGAILLFVLPVDWRARRFTITWDQAVRIDWGIILLFGGGLALGELAFSTGLAEAVGRGIAQWLPVRSTLAFTVLFTATAILMSEAASNTASAAMIIPVAIAVSDAAGIRGIEPALGATLGASMGFMMPISTPPNAIIYSSGYVPITAMMRYGVALDLAAFVIIVIIVMLLGPVLY